MAVKVVDTSAIAAVMFDEPEAEQVMGELEEFELAAPDLLLIELANICLNKGKRRLDQRAAFDRAFEQRGRLGIEWKRLDHDGVLSLANASGLTVYDAAYLWLARSLGVALVSLDQKLLRAVRAV